MTETDKYEMSPVLTQFAFQVQNIVPELSDARSAVWEIFYVDTLGSDDEDVAGRCKKLDPAVRFRTKVDYYILVVKEKFVKMTVKEKLRLISHELFHIERSEGKKSKTIQWKVRHHKGDFCSIQEHDRYSFMLAEKAMKVMYPESN